MNSGRNDRQRISRRIVITHTAAALGVAAADGRVAIHGAGKDQPGNRQLSEHAQGRPALRPLPQLPTAECVQIRPRRHQPEWLVSAVCQEDVVLFVPSTSGSDRYRVVGPARGRASSDKCQGSPCSSSAPRHGRPRHSARARSRPGAPHARSCWRG
jgi:hypothetical protein